MYPRPLYFTLLFVFGRGSHAYKKAPEPRERRCNVAFGDFHDTFNHYIGSFKLFCDEGLIAA